MLRFQSICQNVKQGFYFQTKGDVWWGFFSSFITWSLAAAAVVVVVVVVVAVVAAMQSVKNEMVEKEAGIVFIASKDVTSSFWPKSWF